MCDAGRVLELPEIHYQMFIQAQPFADETGHPAPADTRAWSQLLVSLLTGLSGRDRKKGSDFNDGSDVKGACVWGAIDTPRFNGVIPSGRKTKAAKKAPDISALNDVPFIFFVLWDTKGEDTPRCRVWVVRSKSDTVFRRVCGKWYKQRADGAIKSDNFQLQPPRNIDTDVVRNDCCSMTLPLLFCAERSSTGYAVVLHDPVVSPSMWGWS